MQSLLNLLHSIAPMSPELVEHLKKIVKRAEFKPGELIAKEGRIFPNIYFVEQGMVRIYHMGTKTEITTFFLVEFQFFISPKGFFKGVPAEENIEALEYSICWGITRQELLETCELFPEFDKHRISLTEEYYVMEHDRRKEIQLQSSLEKYTSLVEKRPDLMYRVDVKYLASYMGVMPSTFHAARKLYLKMKGKRK